MLGEARVRTEVDAGRVQEVVSADEEICGRRSRGGYREVGRTGNVARTVGVRDADTVAFGPRGSVRSRDTRGEQHRAAIRGDALQYTYAPATQSEMHEVRVLGTPRVLPDVREARAHARKLAEHRADLIDYV